jgi:copper chaperone CopZ
MFGVLILAVVAFAISPLIAEGEKTDSSEKTDADKTSCSAKADKASCGISAKHASAESKGHCSESDMKACAEKAGMTLEEYKANHKDHAVRTISIDGMTCGGCENSIKEALLKVDGVNRVISISHIDKNAIVCVDASKNSNEALIKAVTDKGYSAEIIPAVAKSESSANPKKVNSKSCGSREKDSCCSKKEESST